MGNRGKMNIVYNRKTERAKGERKGKWTCILCSYYHHMKRFSLSLPWPGQKTPLFANQNKKKQAKITWRLFSLIFIHALPKTRDAARWLFFIFGGREGRMDSFLYLGLAGFVFSGLPSLYCLVLILLAFLLSSLPSLQCSLFRYWSFIFFYRYTEQRKDGYVQQKNIKNRFTAAVVAAS